MAWNAMYVYCFEMTSKRTDETKLSNVVNDISHCNSNRTEWRWCCIAENRASSIKHLPTAWVSRCNRREMSCKRYSFWKIACHFDSDYFVNCAIWSESSHFDDAIIDDGPNCWEDRRRHRCHRRRHRTTKWMNVKNLHQNGIYEKKKENNNSLGITPSELFERRSNQRKAYK